MTHAQQDKRNSTKRRRRRLWSYTAGKYPTTVTVHERERGGFLYLRMWDPAAGNTGRQRRRSLGHRDKERAIAECEREAKRLREGENLQRIASAPTLSYVLGEYLRHPTPAKSAASQREDKRRAEMWIRYLGGEKRIPMLGASEWHGFIRDRLSGAIDPKGHVVPVGKRKTVGARAVDADLVFACAVFNWAMGWDTGGRKLLERNPWAAPAPGVKRQLERPRTRAPKRPVATYDRYLAIREKADAVEMTVIIDGKRTKVPTYLPALLDLVEQIGRRIGAVCRLRYDDIIRKRGVIIELRWRPFKREDEAIVPVSAATREVLEGIFREQPGVGPIPLFPGPTDKTKPISRWIAREWLTKAEALAEVPHLDGGLWHPYRRKWASERKHLPRKDVMKVGGWGDERALRDSYEHADHETMLAVVNEPRKLMERRDEKGA